MIDVKIYYTESGECKKIKKPSWPRIKSPKERVWEKFYSSILESISRTFYPERNLQGNIIESFDGGPRIRDIVSSIRYLKSVNRQEFLYSLDTIYEFNNLKVLVSYPCYKPEVFIRIFFDKQSFYDSKTERIIERVKSPIRQQDQYLLPFSAEAENELFSDTIKKNIPQIYIRRNREGKTITKSCNFKDELSEVAIAVEWDNTNKTLEFFKTKSFDYLFNTQYIPEPIKAEMRASSEEIILEKVQLSPKIPEDNFTAADDKDYLAYQ